MTQRPTPQRAQAVKGAGRSIGIASLRVAGSMVAFAARRPAIVLASVALFGGAGVFAWNATMTQSARHPAPLFASAKPVPAKPEAKPEPVRRAEGPQTTGTTRTDLPTPPARPAAPDAIGSIIKASEAPVKTAETKPKAVETKPKPVETKPKVAEVKPADAKPKPAAEAKSADAKPADAKPQAQPKVASAQKALAKLGYGPITADGLLGSGTRQALEKFERDKKLPVTGGLNPRTSKQLASLSGFAID